jgi:sporulation protein YlmC with PRC-barrel domain
MVMLRSVKTLRGYTVRATDGEIGKVYEFYFDDDSWTIRYLVVDIGKWLPERRVLISTHALKQPNWMKSIFPVSLTKEQVKKSPDIYKEKPVSRQREIELHDYYRWPVYWGSNAPATTETPITEHPERTNAAKLEKESTATDEDNSHLRSTREVIGYSIQASDGEIGHVEDFIVDDENWGVRYMVVDTRNWLPGEKVVVSPQWIEKVSWEESDVHINLTRKSVKNSPEFDASTPVNREYEEILYDYYGRPKYWV